MCSHSAPLVFVRGAKRKGRSHRITGGGSESSEVWVNRGTMTCSHSTEVGLRTMVTQMYEASHGRCVTRTDPKTAWRAQKRRKRCAWKTMPSVGRKAHFWLNTRMFSGEKTRSEIDVFSGNAGRRGTNSTRKCVFAQGR